jgi:uncharacterized protein YuzE
MTKLEYDPKVDALYVRFGSTAVVESEEVRPGIVIDFDANGRIVSLEILDARNNLTPNAFPLAAE